MGSSLHLAAAALYEHRLDNLGRVFAGEQLAPVVVKGQAIVDLAYPADEARLSGDVDLLVGDDEAAVCAALIAAGYAERADDTRRSSSALLGERVFVTGQRTLPAMVEVHRFFDKAILRPIDYAGILKRAVPSRRPGLRYPTAEDLLLLVVLHESVAKTPSLDRTLRDVRMITHNSRPDMTVVQARASAWQLQKALSAVLAGRPSSAPADASALAYLLAQRHQHDSLLTWAVGLLGYAKARMRDRLPWPTR